MNVVRLEDVIKEYRGWRRSFVAVNGVSFNIGRGRVVGLLGPNGAGKTTIIKLIMGLLNPTRGEVEVLGAKRRIGIAEKSRIGFLTEENYLYGFLDVRETIELAARLCSHPKAALERVPEMLEWVGMQGFEKRKISECSKGMARRAALAQSLVHDPEFVILDEPMSGFDPVGIHDVREIILRLKRQGKTVLVCSHLLAEVEEVIDDVIIMFKGKVVASGDIKNLLKGSGVSISLKPEDAERVIEWLASQNIPHQPAPSHNLEHFFIETIRACREG